MEPRGGQLDSRSPAWFHVRNWKLMEAPSCAGVPGSTKWLLALGNVTGTDCGWEQEKEALPWGQEADLRRPWRWPEPRRGPHTPVSPARITGRGAAGVASCPPNSPAPRDPDRSSCSP